MESQIVYFYSYVGACQLGVDLNFVKRWLGDAIANSDVRQSILDLTIFKYLSGAVLILKKQPYRKGGGGRFREPCSTEDLSKLCFKILMKSFS